ncbi:TonB-dependent receptor [Gilvimarinus sp. F26214L]|uniref:TonB-dependent receptor n=1 Tax=Gilvimarinus sp. DZF01 TaxID=3461371 RepID=UPI004045AAE8
MTCRRSSLALAVTLTASLAAQGAERQITEEIVVTASRSERPLSTIPNTVTLIDAKDLEQQLSINHDLSTVLGNLVPSFSPSRQKLTNAGESLRGRSPLYLVDGVPQSNPLRDGSRDGHTIDPLMLERVEVIHGANAIHGLGASGGIINLITRKPAAGFRQSVRAESFTQEEDLGESLGYGLNYNLSAGGERADVMASVGYRSSGIHYDGNGEPIGFDNAQGDTMDSDMVNVFVKGGYQWDDQRLELTVNHFDLTGSTDWVAVEGDKAAGIPTTAIEGRIPGDEPRNEVTMFSANYSNEEVLDQRLRLQIFHQDFAATYGGGEYATFQDPAYGPDLFDQSQNNSEKRGLKLTLVKDDIAGLPLNLVYGVDYLRDTTYQELVQTGRNWVPATEYENIAPYLQAEFSGLAGLTVTAGVRHEDSKLNVDDFVTLASYGSQYVTGGDPDFAETLYNAGLTFQATEHWRVFANYSEGFSMPDVGRVLRGIDVPNQSVESFLALDPIITENSELGAEFNAHRVSAQLSYFTSDSDFGQRLEADADGFYSVQRERTAIDGIEFRFNWLATQADTLGLRYAATEGEYDSDDNGRVDSDLDGANVAPDRLNLSWERGWSESINSRLQLNHLLDRRFKDAAGNTTARFDGYTTVDLNLEVLALGGAFNLSVQNLGDRNYFTYYAQTMGNDSRNFAGMGRSFSLSYHREF